MKRILEVINLYENAVNFIGSQFSYLSQYGDYEMHLICSKPLMIDKGISVEDFCQKHHVRYKLITLNRELTPFQDVKALLGVCKYIKNNKIDIIIAHQTKGVLIGMLAGLLTRTPYKIIMAHGVLTDTMKGLKKALIDYQTSIMCHIADKIICVSSCVKDAYSKFEDKTILLGHGSCTGIDTEQHFNPENLDANEVEKIRRKFGVTDQDYIIGFSGRLVKDKGIMELIEAFRRLREKYQHVKLLVIGPKEVRDSIPQDAFDFLMNNKSVIFTGYVDYAKIQYYYSQMNVCLLPSYREGLGLAPLEAEAMGVPAIVSGHTGCRETIVDGETGYLCDLTPESIFEKIELLLDKDKARMMGVRARTFVQENFKADIVHENMLLFLNSL